jgi:hypothetical protein
LLSLVAALALPLGLAQAAAAAPGQTLSTHYTSVASWGTPTAPITNISDCPAPVIYDYNYLTGTGNGKTNQNFNNNGFWETSSFTGNATATFYSASNLTFDSDGNVTGTTGPPDMVVTGHLTDWFGVSDNKQNLVEHGTIDFHGTVVSGPGTGGAISFHNDTHGAWLPGADLNGPPSFFFNVASC